MMRLCCVLHASSMMLSIEEKKMNVFNVTALFFVSFVTPSSFVNQYTILFLSFVNQYTILFLSFVNQYTILFLSFVNQYTILLSFVNHYTILFLT